MAKKTGTVVTSPKLGIAEPTTGLHEKVLWVCDQMDGEYGKLTWKSHGEPLGALVATILSQHTSDKNSERAYDNLRRVFAQWDVVRMAPVEEIREAIRSAGLAEVKAPRIRAVLEQIHERVGETSLDFLYDTPTKEAREYLLDFKGVGPKTAACVLMFSLGRPVLPVDTHVFRVSHRLGLIEKKIGEAKAHDALQELLPDERVYPFHVHLIRHGRRVCTARQPDCAVCVLQERCDYYRENGTQKRTPAGGNQQTETRTVHGLSVMATDGERGAS